MDRDKRLHDWWHGTAHKGGTESAVFDAANLLIDAIKRDEMEDYKLVNPSLFLYRHAIELMLKSFVGSFGHDLASLAEKFEAAVKNRFWSSAATLDHVAAKGNRRNRSKLYGISL